MCQEIIKKYNFPIDKPKFVCYNCKARNGRLAQLGEHLPYKQRVTGSSPVLSTRTERFIRDGLVAQLVRALACHARGRGFEPHPSRHPVRLCSSVGRAGDWKSPCRWFDSDRRHHFCGFSSFGRAPPCQGGGGGFEPRNPLQNKKQTLVVCFLFWNPTLWSCAVPKRRKALNFAFAKLYVLLRTKAKQLSVIPLRDLGL